MLQSQKGGLSVLWKQLQVARIGHTEHLQLHFKQRRGFGALLLQKHQGVSDSSHRKGEPRNSPVHTPEETEL